MNVDNPNRMLFNNKAEGLMTQQIALIHPAMSNILYSQQSPTHLYHSRFFEIPSSQVNWQAGRLAVVKSTKM